MRRHHIAARLTQASLCFAAPVAALLLSTSDRIGKCNIHFTYSVLGCIACRKYDPDFPPPPFARADVATPTRRQFLCAHDGLQHRRLRRQWPYGVGGGVPGARPRNEGHSLLPRPFQALGAGVSGYRLLSFSRRLYE